MVIDTENPEKINAKPLFSIDQKINRLFFFLVFCGIAAIAVSGGYLLRWYLLTQEGGSTFYLEITFVWQLFILSVLTPFAIQRLNDMGLSGWWISILWGSLPLDLKFLLIISKYTDQEISGSILTLGMVPAVAALVLLLLLLFAKSDRWRETVGVINKKAETGREDSIQ